MEPQGVCKLTRKDLDILIGYSTYGSPDMAKKFLEDKCGEVMHEGELPRELPKARINGKVYYIDLRLKELRNVNNPNDRLTLED